MSVSAQSARSALGAAPPLFLPVEGPERLAMLARLKSMFAADVTATLDRLVLAGWRLDDVHDAVVSYTAWLHAFLAEAVDEGLERWGRLP